MLAEHRAEDDFLMGTVRLSSDGILFALRYQTINDGNSLLFKMTAFDALTLDVRYEFDMQSNLEDLSRPGLLESAAQWEPRSCAAAAH